MIIVKLAGGIGNQMFQYACGHALAAKYAAPLALDHSFLEQTPPPGVTLRSYELHAFGIDKRLGPEDMPPLREPSSGNNEAGALGWLKKLFRAARGENRENPYSYFVEDVARLDLSFFENGDRQYLSGYFQNECYFSSAGEELRTVFTFVPVRSEANARLARTIRAAENPVSIHVRRGDYLNVANQGFHGLCSLDYYARAIDIIRSRVSNPTFFVFAADDPQWAREAFTPLGLGDSILGDENAGPDSYEDMRMMSLCKHHIIANSTFSWWGAWLGGYPDKIVVCPERWFAEPQLAHVNPALPGWIRI